MFQTIESSELELLLKEKFGDKIQSVDKLYDVSCAIVAQESIHQILKFLFENGFEFLTSLNAMHFPDAEEKFGMVYHLHDWKRNYRIRIKTFTNQDPPYFPTVTDIWPTANWMERQEYDFFGIHFRNHPDLRRILNMDSMEGWPLRKEYPLEDQARYDKDDKMFGR